MNTEHVITAAPGRDPQAYCTVIMETHHVMRADVTIIVHAESDGLARTLHDLCVPAIRQAMVLACEPSEPLAAA